MNQLVPKTIHLVFVVVGCPIARRACRHKLGRSNYSSTVFERVDTTIISLFILPPDNEPYMFESDIKKHGLDQQGVRVPGHTPQQDISTAPKQKRITHVRSSSSNSTPQQDISTAQKQKRITHVRSSSSNSRSPSVACYFLKRHLASKPLLFS